MIRYRNLIYGDRIPVELTIGFRQEDLTPDLVWVAVDDSRRIIGVLVAMAAHGFFFPQRVFMAKTAPKWALLRLLRKGFRDARQRGYHLFFVILDKGTEAGKSFQRMIELGGGASHWEEHNAWVGGAVDPMISVAKRNVRKNVVAV